MSKQNKPYSYHTFFFPFLWNHDGKTRKEFTKCLDVGHAWKKQVYDDKDAQGERMNEYYNQYHYFNSAARNILYPDKTGSNIAENYCYDMSVLCEKTDEQWLTSDKTHDNPAKYVVKKVTTDTDMETGEKIVKEIKYELPINGIRLKLFNTGVGLLIFELENYSYPKESEVRQINEWCRRIFMPFTSGSGCLGTDKCKECKDYKKCDLEKCIYSGDNSVYDRDGKNCSSCEHNKKCKKLECFCDVKCENDCDGTKHSKCFFTDSGICSDCADEISIEYNGNVVTGELTGKPERFTETKLAEPIKRVLSNGGYFVTTDEKSKDKNTFYIEPMIDDRMYVACYYINKDFVNPMTQWCGDKYRYLSDAIEKPLGDSDNKASDLYKMVFVDGGDLTCQSHRMLYEMLEDHIYDRWAGYGSLTGITEYSMVSLTNSDAEFLVRNFLTEYVEMMSIALAQRASLLNFERRLSDAANRNGDIKTIHKDYVNFQSQILLKEITPQQQGIELYSMLRKNMYIDEYISEIEGQIEALYAQKNADSEARENAILFILSVLSVFEAIEVVADWASGGFVHLTSILIPSWICGGIKLGFSLCLIAVCFIWFNKHRRKG